MMHEPPDYDAFDADQPDDGEDIPAPKTPLDYITRGQVHDLWGAGFTIVRRHLHPDPFYVPPEMVPQGRSYQWWHLVHDKEFFYRPPNAEPSGWAPVPASRHDGYFMPAGHVGDIEVNGLGLFEKSKFEVDQAKAQQVAAAHQQVHDWKKVTSAMFSGDVSVGGERTAIGETKSYENTTAIPRDMVPYIDKIFAERDYLAKCYAEESAGSEPSWSTVVMGEISDKFQSMMRDNIDTPKWPALNAIILPYAIENVRKQIKEAASGEAS